MKCPTCQNEFSDSVFPFHILRCVTVAVDPEPIQEEPEAQEETKAPPVTDEPKKRKR